MRAARVAAFGSPPELADIAEPTRGPGESLVRVDAAVVAHLDGTIASGNFGLKPSLPYTPGVEGAGTVLESATHPPGTRVMIRGGGVGMRRDGCWAELVAAPDGALRPAPDGLPVEVAASFFVPLVTAYVALHDVGRFAPPEPVLVTGASGAVGSAVVQLALDAGCRKVVAVVGRSGHATALPDDDRVVALVGDDERAIAEGLRPECPLLAVDTVGGPTLAAVLASVPAGGRVATLGYTRGTELHLHLPDFLLRDVELRPVNAIRRDARGRELVSQLAALLRAGRVGLQLERFALDDLPAALARLASGEAVGRVVVLPGGPA